MTPDSKINLDWLVTFDSAAQSLSFTKTAADRGLSQGAVSIQIRKLEQALGAALFERRGRHIVLTDEGHAYHPQVSATLAELRETTARLFSHHRRTVVTIACYSPTFADLWLAPRLARVMAQINGLQIDLTIDYQAGHSGREGDDLTFMVDPHHGGAHHDGIGAPFLPLHKEQLIAVCAPSYAAQWGENWGRGILIDSVASRGSWPAWRAATESQIALDGREMRVNSMSAALKLAEGGAGAALVNRAFVAPLLAAGKLVDLLPNQGLAGRVHGISTAGLDRARPITKRTAALLLEDASIPLPPYLQSL